MRGRHLRWRSHLVGSPCVLCARASCRQWCLVWNDSKPSAASLPGKGDAKVDVATTSGQAQLCDETMASPEQPSKSKLLPTPTSHVPALRQPVTAALAPSRCARRSACTHYHSFVDIPVPSAGTIGVRVRLRNISELLVVRAAQSSAAFANQSIVRKQLPLAAASASAKRLLSLQHAEQSPLRKPRSLVSWRSPAGTGESVSTHIKQPAGPRQLSSF